MTSVITSDYSLYHGDCLQLMTLIPDHSVDMVLCDLPYGCTRNKWDKKIPFKPLWEQYKRVLKSGGVVALFCKQRFTIETAASNLKDFRYKLVWFKKKGTDFLNANRKPLSSHEDVCIFYSSQPTYNPQKRHGYEAYSRRNGSSKSSNWDTHRLKNCFYSENTDGTRYPLDVVTFNNCNNVRCSHSTGKPVDLLEWLIKTYTHPSMTILDNCMGGGACGVAAANTGRRFIGIEIHDEFYARAVQKIEAAYQAKQIEHNDKP